MLPLFWVTYTDSSTTDYSWTLRRACGTKMSKARPMGASPPHITVGKQASRLGLGFEKLLCGLLTSFRSLYHPWGRRGASDAAVPQPPLCELETGPHPQHSWCWGPHMNWEAALLSANPEPRESWKEYLTALTLSPSTSALWSPG